MRKKRNKRILVQIDSPHKLATAAIYLIEKIRSKNKMRFDLLVAYDFNMKEMGCYYPNLPHCKHIIFVNPLQCLDRDEDTPPPLKISCEGYTTDFSLFGVIIHEFCHFLQFNNFKNIEKNYRHKFPTQRFYINSYCNNEIIDENMANLLPFK